MEPISFSLLAIGTSGMALRRMTRDHAVPFPERRRAPKTDAAKSIAAALTCRPIMDGDMGLLADPLTRLADQAGLRLNAQVALDALFATSRGNAPLDAALEGRRVDFVFTDADHMPVCGVEIRTEDDVDDPIRDGAFAVAGLPLIRLDATDSWAHTRRRLADALGLAARANSDGAPKGRTRVAI